MGWGYWHGFMSCNKHLLRGRKITPYSIDWANFNNFLNFSDMFNHIEQILLESKIATKLKEPVWMDAEGNEVSDEMDVYGYKATIKIDRPTGRVWV